MPDSPPATASTRAPEPSGTSAPVAPRRATERVHHGDVFVDHYEWLRDKGGKEVLAHLEAENAYTASMTAHLADLREELFDDIRSRVQETDLSVPVRFGGHWYYSRTIEGRQYGLSCRRPVTDAASWLPPGDGADTEVPDEEVLLDLNDLAEGTEFFSLGASSVSPSGRLLAYSTDTTGAERFTLSVKDLRTGEVLPDTVAEISYGATWATDDDHLFYTTVDAAWRPDKVWRHRLGTPASDDVVVHHETDERFWTSVGRTRSDAYLVISSASKTTSEYRVCPADRPLEEFRVLAPRRQGVEYGIEHAVVEGQQAFLVLHNDGVDNFTLAITDVEATSHEEWRTLLPADPNVRLEDVDAFAGHVVISQRSAGLTQLRILRLAAEPSGGEGGSDGDSDGGGPPVSIVADRLVEMDHPLYTVGLGSNPEFDQPTLRYGYTTMVTPASVFQIDLRTAERTMLRTTPVLPHPTYGDFDPDAYEQHRTWAPAEDGTLVPISIVQPAGSPRDGSTPFVLYGYGAYETSIDPTFSIARLSLLDRGAGFAIAHVRGGGEMGRQWYDEGKMLNKRTTFTDFVSCARHVVAQRWTAPEHLVAEGGSAGGLLMGAVANLAPEAFSGILADVPFVDPLTSMLDPSLPLTVTEWEEWGDPLHDAEVYAYLRSYSPYENLRATQYPPILVETSLNDTRVLYVEPAKWVAALRHLSSSTDQVLLRTEMVAGHGGVSGRYNAWRDRAFSYAWVLDRLGLGGARAS